MNLQLEACNLNQKIPARLNGDFFAGTYFLSGVSLMRSAKIL